MKLKNKVSVNLDWDGDTASLTEERVEKLIDGGLVDFTLEVEVEEKTYRSGSHDLPDDVEVVVSHIAISDVRVFDRDDEEVFLSDIEVYEMGEHIRESIIF